MILTGSCTSYVCRWCWKGLSFCAKRPTSTTSVCICLASIGVRRGYINMIKNNSSWLLHQNALIGWGKCNTIGDSWRGKRSDPKHLFRRRQVTPNLFKEKMACEESRLTCFDTAYTTVVYHTAKAVKWFLNSNYSMSNLITSDDWKAVGDGVKESRGGVK